MCDSTVMLSEAKHLSAHRDRPFAALRACVWITHIVAPGGSAHRSPPRAVFRPLVAAPRSDAWLRCTGPDQVTMWVIHTLALNEVNGVTTSGTLCRSRKECYFDGGSEPGTLTFENTVCWRCHARAIGERDSQEKASCLSMGRHLVALARCRCAHL